MDVLSTHMIVYHMCAFRDQKKALDPLELELQMLVSCRVGTGKKILVL